MSPKNFTHILPSARDAELFDRVLGSFSFHQNLRMLPRHLQGLIIRSAIRSRTITSQRANFIYPASFRIVAFPQYASGFHSSTRRRNELPKSPFQRFVEVLREELQKDRELQENVKQLQGDVDKLQDAETLKKARVAYERARVRTTTCFCGN